MTSVDIYRYGATTQQMEFISQLSFQLTDNFPAFELEKLVRFFRSIFQFNQNDMTNSNPKNRDAQKKNSRAEQGRDYRGRFTSTQTARQHQEKQNVNHEPIGKDLDASDYGQRNENNADHYQHQS
jgi:hypothetical protein